MYNTYKNNYSSIQPEWDKNNCSAIERYVISSNDAYSFPFISPLNVLSELTKD